MQKEGEFVRDQSEFNMAVSYLNRLNTLFYACDNASINLDVHTWYHSLLALFRELSTEMKEEEIKEWENKSNDINNLITRNINDYKRTGSNQVSNELYKELHTFELFIRKTLKEAGLQTKMMQDPSKALG